MIDEAGYHSTVEKVVNGSGIRSPNASSSSSTGTDAFYDCQESEDLEVIPSVHGRVSLVPLARASSSPTCPPIASSTISHSTTLLEQTLFFGSGLGSSLCYIATLSSLVHYKLLYGANSFVYLNLAVYVPLLPISLAQARWDQSLDVRYTSPRTFLVRGVVGFVLGLVGTSLMIRGDGDPQSGQIALIIHALLQGTGGAILYGTLNQLASFVGGDDGPILKAAVSAGVQVSALVVLAVSFLTGFGVHEASRFSWFLWNISAIELLCFVVFICLLLARSIVAAAMIRRDASLRLDEDAAMDNDDDAIMGTALLMTSRQTSSLNLELPYVELVSKSRPCCLVLVATLLPSFLVGSWFTRVQTDWMELASCLFYVRIASDFLGRLATIVIPPRSTSCLTGTCLLRMVPVVVFFFNAHQVTPFADGLSIALVAIISFLSGYLVTGCYQLAPLDLDWEVREANAAKQASLLTVAFAISAVCGLLSSFALMALGI